MYIRWQRQRRITCTCRWGQESSGATTKITSPMCMSSLKQWCCNNAWYTLLCTFLPRKPWHLSLSLYNLWSRSTPLNIYIVTKTNPQLRRINRWMLYVNLKWNATPILSHTLPHRRNRFWTPLLCLLCRFYANPQHQRTRKNMMSYAEKKVNIGKPMVTWGMLCGISAEGGFQPRFSVEANCQCSS